MSASRIDDDGNKYRLQSSSDWILVSDNKAFLKDNPSEPSDWKEDNIPAPLWTDQYSNLFQILRSPSKSWWSILTGKSDD